MKNQTITYYTIGSYRESLDNSAELNFVSRELANEHILKELVPKNLTPNIELNDFTITKKEKVWVDHSYPVYYKDETKGIRKYIEERVQEDKYTETHNFKGYVSSEYKWREKVNGWGEKPVGYYLFKTGDLTSEITEHGVSFKAPVSVQFVKAELIVMPEIKEDGKPYQARKEEVKQEIVSDWLPVYVIHGKGQYDETKYCIDPEWTDGSWWKRAEPYFAEIEYIVNENQIEIVTEL